VEKLKVSKSRQAENGATSIINLLIMPIPFNYFSGAKQEGVQRL
jgi:hypothetical protein